jgi:ADP-ribose pyrophosphatase YjhB (NUDIX family)
MEKFKKWAGIILKHKNTVLMCKRSPDKSMPNTWSIPSGKIEEEELPNKAALREFFEETDIQLEPNINFVGFITKFKKDGEKKGHMLVFSQEIEKKIMPDLESARDGFEHTECKYFDVEELPETEQNKGLIDLIKKITN